MDENPTSKTISCTSFTAADICALVDAGFLISINVANTCSSFSAISGASPIVNISASGARHVAGSLEAVGGASARQHIHGGLSLASSRSIAASKFSFSLPNTGTHIKLLVEARNHLLNILKKTKYKEMPLCALRERWNGGVIAQAGQWNKRRSRVNSTGILPGRAKKWKQFYGMRFEWILGECVGSGLLELFETGSVGRAARLTL